MLKFWKKTLLIFSILLLFCTSSDAKVLKFAQIGDVHYSRSDNALERYLYFLNLSVKKSNVDFAVFLGNNVAKSTEENVIGLMQSLYSWQMPYYLVLGNNDAHKLSGIEKDVYLDIVTAFNHNQKDRKKYYYFKPNKDFICVVLDDTPDFVYSRHGEISDEQLIWLDNLLNKYHKKMFIIFQHSPLNPPREEYKLSMLNTDKYREIINKHSNILIMSSGHYRQNAINQDDNGIWHISAPSFADNPHFYQIIKITYNTGKFKSPKDVNVSLKKVKV